MKYMFAFGALLLALPSLSMGSVVRWDDVYGNPNGSMNTVSCSDGTYGLASRFPTFSRVPTFPNVGAVSGAAWGSAKCGTCWELSYKSKRIYITAIDNARNADEFIISKKAMDTLTSGQAGPLGTVQATAKQVDKSNCRL
ncbi:hypothetical protein ONZ45_g5628 [Pleurotus djamor]|nr:hypothetical protein ONZ45_g5628 [Pleurotus djamor]